MYDVYYFKCLIPSLFEMYDVYVLSPINYLVNFPYNFIFYNEVRVFDFTFYFRKCWQWRVRVRYMWMLQKQTQMWHHLLMSKGQQEWSKAASHDLPSCNILNWCMTDVSFSCVVKHKDDGQTKFINPNSQRQDRIIKYWVSIGSIHREQGWL